MNRSITQIVPQLLRHRRRVPIVFGLVFATIGGLIFATLFGPVLVGAIRSRNWVATPCTIFSSQVEESHSSEDGTTYRVAARYRYEYAEHTFLGDRYSWSTHYTSGYMGKREIVDQLQPGTQAVCYVNPANPSESVLDRNVGWDVFAVMPLVFVVMGLAAAVFAKPSGAASEVLEPDQFDISRAAMAPIQTHDSGPLELRPPGTPGFKRLWHGGLIGFALLWNGIVGCILWFGVLGGGQIDVFGAIFIIPFVIAGLVAIGIVIYSLMKLRNPEPVVTLSKSVLRLGDSLEVRWKIDGRVDRISALTITIEGREVTIQRRGEITRTNKRMFAKAEVAHVTWPTQIGSGRAVVRLPKDSKPTHDAGNNRIQWVLIIHGDIPSFPDMREEFTLDVCGPEAIAAT